jgi:hypothetical protein
MTDQSNQPKDAPSGALVSPASLVNRWSPDYRSIYSNNSKFAISPFDLAFTLSQVTENENGEIFVENHARVVMPPLHAKLFALLLFENIKNFEAQFGEIKVPDNMFATVPVSPELEQKPAQPDTDKNK